MIAAWLDLTVFPHIRVGMYVYMLACSYLAFYQLKLNKRIQLNKILFSTGYYLNFGLEVVDGFVSERWE